MDANAWASGHLLAGCSGSTVIVWNAHPGSEHAPGTLTHRITAPSTLNSVQWTSTNKVLASAGAGGIVSLYHAGDYLGCLPNAETGTTVHMGEITCVRFSRDSRMVYAGSTDSTIYCWDLKSQVLGHRFSEHKAPISSIAVAPEDKYIASSSTNGSLMMHTPTSSKAFVTLAPAVKSGERLNERRCLTFSPLEEGVLAAAGDDHTVTIWSTMGGKSTQFSLPKKHMGRVTGVALSPQSAAYVYSCATDGVVAMWDKRYGEKAQASMLQQQPTAQFTSLALRDDGLHVAAGTKDGMVYVLDARKPGVVAELRTEDRRPITELHWQSAFRGKKPASSSASALTARATAAAAPQQPTPVSSAYPTTATTKFDASAAAAAAVAAAPKPSSVQAQVPGRASSGGLQGSLSNWLHAPATGTDQDQDQPVAQGQGVVSAASTAFAPQDRQQPPQQQQPSTAPPLKEATNKVTGAAPALQVAAGGAGERRPPPALNSSVMGPGVVEGVGAAAPGAEVCAGEAAQASGTAVSPTSPTKGISGSGRVLNSGLSGVMRGGLSEAVFKGVIEEVTASVRDDIRNLHIELLRQFHMQQMEMGQLVQEVVRRQDAQAAEIRELRRALDLLTHKESLGAWL